MRVIACVCVCVHLGVYVVSDPVLVSLMLTNCWIVMPNAGGNPTTIKNTWNHQPAMWWKEQCELRRFRDMMAQQLPLKAWKPTPIPGASAATSPHLGWKPALSPGDSCKCHSTGPRPVQHIAAISQPRLTSRMNDKAEESIEADEQA